MEGSEANAARNTEGGFEKSPSIRQRLGKTARLLGIAALGYAVIPEGQATAQTYESDQQRYEEVQDGEDSKIERVNEAIDDLKQLTEKVDAFNLSFSDRDLLTNEAALQEKVAEAEDFVEQILSESQRVNAEIVTTLSDMNNTHELELEMRAKGGVPDRECACCGARF